MIWYRVTWTLPKDAREILEEGLEVTSYNLLVLFVDQRENLLLRPLYGFILLMQLL